MALDFAVLTFPRCGSHMLASALDSHPDIDCRGELWREVRYDFSGVGKIHGGIINPSHMDEIDDKTKMIVLTRYRTDKMQHSHNYLPSHALKPETIRADGKSFPSPYYDFDLLLRTGERFQHLVFDYSDITNDQDIRELPDYIGNAICDFLNVERKKLTPKFYKPSVVP